MDTGMVTVEYPRKIVEEVTRNSSQNNYIIYNYSKKLKNLREEDAWADESLAIRDESLDPKILASWGKDKAERVKEDASYSLDSVSSYAVYEPPHPALDFDQKFYRIFYKGFSVMTGGWRKSGFGW